MSAIDSRSSKALTDRRSLRTRAAILQAFVALVLEGGYDVITPTNLAAKANVGRSTFYAHFANVDEVLAFSIGALLAPLVDSTLAPAMQPASVQIVQHFWGNRKVARSMIGGGGHAVVSRLFTDQFEVGLAKLRRTLGVETPMVAPRLAAAHLSAGALALLGAWLSGQASGSATQVATALHAAGHATAMAMSCEAHAAARSPSP